MKINSTAKSNLFVVLIIFELFETAVLGAKGASLPFSYWVKPTGNTYQALKYFLTNKCCTVEFSDPMIYASTMYAIYYPETLKNCSYDQTTGFFKLIQNEK
jgi:hypothetical protein